MFMLQLYCTQQQNPKIKKEVVFCLKRRRLPSPEAATTCRQSFVTINGVQNGSGNFGGDCRSRWCVGLVAVDTMTACGSKLNDTSTKETKEMRYGRYEAFTASFTLFVRP